MVQPHLDLALGQPDAVAAQDLPDQQFELALGGGEARCTRIEDMPQGCEARAATGAVEPSVQTRHRGHPLVQRALQR